MYDNQASQNLQTLVYERIDSWRAGEEPNASRLLTEHPELRGAKSLVMDLALAEYTLRTEAGDKIAKSEFCDRFPAYRQSIAKLLEVQEFLDQCPQFAEKDSSRWPIPGDDFLGFEIVEPMGRGGLARVFLARELSLGNRQVVVKVSRFASREAHTLGKLLHPSIMPVHSVKCDDVEGWTAICMPLVGAATGVDLLDEAFAHGARRDGQLVYRVAESTRPVEAATTLVPPNEQFDWNITYPQAIGRLGLQLAEALTAAHAAGILHRDIKPSNILLAWSGRPLLLDFNLSSDSTTSLQGVGGTLAYMAPELIASVLTDQGRTARQFDPRYDIYSLGAVLYELLTGNLPAKPANADKLPIDAYQPWLDCKRAALIAPANPIDAVNKPLYDIVAKCLAFDPAHRFLNAAELTTALHGYLESLKPTPAVQKPQRSYRRSIFASLVALVFVTPLGFSGYLTFTGPRIAPPESVESFYERGLEDYDAERYDNAVENFTRCLIAKPGWHKAHFARAQVLRKQEKYDEACADYLATRSSADQRWSDVLAGLCYHKSRDLTPAEACFDRAYNAGLRNIEFLFNYAEVKERRMRRPKAVEIYTEIIAAQPLNLVARHQRVVVGAREKQVGDFIRPPTAETMAEAEEYLRLAPETFDSAYCAAKVYGEAVLKKAPYRERAVACLTLALQRGLPLEHAEGQYMMKPLLELVDPKVLENAVRNADFHDDPIPFFDFPCTPDSVEFLRQVGE